MTDKNIGHAGIFPKIKRKLKRKLAYFKKRKQIINSLSTNPILYRALDVLDYFYQYAITRKFKLAFLCDSSESRLLLELGLNSKIMTPDDLVIVKNTSPPSGFKNLQNYDSPKWFASIDCLAVPRLLDRNYTALQELYKDLTKKNRDLVIYDQISGMGGTYLDKTKQIVDFRDLKLVLNHESVLPSYYANSQYINILVDYAKKQPEIRMMDICAGQGCIGLSTFHEAGNISYLLNVEINPNQLKCIELSIDLNQMDRAKIQCVESDVFSNVPQGMKFDLISGNPPHQNGPAHTLIEAQGADHEWGFHRRFFKDVGSYLAKNGIICLIENGRPDYSSVLTFKDIISQTNASLELFDHYPIPGSEWYLIFVRKK